MTGLILVIIAFVLFIIETHIPSFGIFGIMALVSLFSGGHMLVEQGEIFGVPVGWNIFIGIAVAMIAIMVFVGKETIRGLKAKDTAGIEGMINQEATIENWDGTSGRVMIQGELWQAFSEKPYNFEKGDIVIINEVQDLKLKICQKN